MHPLPHQPKNTMYVPTLLQVVRSARHGRLRRVDAEPEHACAVPIQVFEEQELARVPAERVLLHAPKVLTGLSTRDIHAVDRLHGSE